MIKKVRLVKINERKTYDFNLALHLARIILVFKHRLNRFLALLHIIEAFLIVFLFLFVFQDLLTEVVFCF